jgi:hypothetical protein
VALGSLTKALELLRAQAQVADLTLDFGELGRTVLRHSRTSSSETVVEALRSFVEERQGLLSVDHGLLFEQFVRPFCELLGYSPRLRLPNIETAPRSIRATLFACERRRGRLQALERAELLGFPSGTDLASSGHGTALALTLAAADEATSGRAIATDGRRWCLVEAGRTFVRPAVDLIEILKGSSSSTTEEFLATFHT